MRSQARSAALIFAVALTVRMLYLATLLPTGCLAINSDPISDMDTFHRWAGKIAAGDWLGKEDFHPYHPWQKAIASEETWQEWYGPKVFHQDPLYAYFAAAVYSLAGTEPLALIAVQLLLGAATASGIGLLARRLAGARAGLAAGLLAAFYAPFLFYESLLLRDTLLILLSTAFLLVVEEARRRPGPLPWALAGVVAGVTYLNKPNIVVVLPLLAAWMVLDRVPGRPWRAAVALAGGFALAVMPAVARNVAVGAPPLKTTTRGAIEFINGNNPYHIGIGWFDGDDRRVAGYARSVMLATRGRLLPTVARVMWDWRSDPLGWAGLQLRKLGYLLAPFEMPNNASFSFFRLNSPVLGLGLPTFFVVSPLAVLGLVASLGWWRRLLPHYLFLASGIAVTVAFYVIARFRTPFLPLALVFAGAGAERLVAWTRERDLARLSAGLALVATVLVVNVAANHPDRALVRPRDYLVSARAFSGEGRHARAAGELEEGLEIFTGSFPLQVEAARAWERAGDPDRALSAWLAAQRLQPGAGWIAEEIRRLETRDPGAP